MLLGLQKISHEDLTTKIEHFSQSKIARYCFLLFVCIFWYCSNGRCIHASYVFLMDAFEILISFSYCKLGIWVKLCKALTLCMKIEQAMHSGRGTTKIFFVYLPKDWSFNWFLLFGDKICHFERCAVTFHVYSESNL